MEKVNQPHNSPFRQKIFDLMKQQQTSKILKLSQKFQNKTLNTSHSPFKQFSIHTEMNDDSKIIGLDSSHGVLHFKSVQQKLGLKNLSKSKSKQKEKKSKSFERDQMKNLSKPKKVSFIQTSSYPHFQSTKSQSKEKNKKSKNSVNNSFQKSSSSYNLKNKPNMNKQKSSVSNNKNLSRKKSKSSVNNSFQNSSKNLKIFKENQQNSQKRLFESTNQNLQSYEKETEKKNYLLQTLRKMESVRKNLSKTFQQFDSYNDQTVRSNDDSSIKKNKSKEKSKSNLTVISDSINQDHENCNNYTVKNNFSKNQKSKSKVKESKSKEKIRKIEIIPNDIFHKKTPTKRQKHQSHINESLSGGYSSSNKKPLIQKILSKQIVNSCKNPQKWQTILQNDLVSVHFRIVKRKLIEIELHAQQYLTSLNLQLEKGAFICQSVKENYENIRKKEIITLLCSVRGIQTNDQGIDLFSVPKIRVCVETKMEGNLVTFNKYVQLPFTWIMLIEREKKEKFCSSAKKSNQDQFSNRIKTRSMIQNLELCKTKKFPNLIEIFSFCQEEPPSNSKKPAKKQASNIQYPFSFELQGQQYKLIVKMNYDPHSNTHAETRRTYNLQLQGKGEGTMEKMLMFLQTLG